MSVNQAEFVVYPAIDILDGQAVRLLRGDYGETTVYHDKPEQVARNWVQQGASYLHVVDLDGAREGSQRNRPVIEQIVKSVNVPVQVGGGIRDAKTLEALFSIGVARCILGTAAVNDPAFVQQALKDYGDRIVIGIDAKNGWVAVNGWQDTSDISAVDLGVQLKEWGADTVIFTDIARDGTLTGPNLAANMELAEKTGLQVIASGGVKDTDCLLQLVQLRNVGVTGAIVGKALYTGNINLKTALQQVAEVSLQAPPAPEQQGGML